MESKTLHIARHFNQYAVILISVCMHVCMDAWMYAHVHVCTCMQVSVAVPRQDSMIPARANAVLSGHCNRFAGYP